MAGSSENCNELYDLMGGLFVSNPKGSQHWVFIGRTEAEAEVATSSKELTRWKRP